MDGCFVRETAVRQVVADAIKIVPNTAEDALYVHADHLGTPQKMTDETAAVVWDATYLPFGSEDAITGTATNEQRFPGQYRDAETGLHYNYFRDYDPAIGRYLQSDPIGGIGLGDGLERLLDEAEIRFTGPTRAGPRASDRSSGTILVAELGDAAKTAASGATATDADARYARHLEPRQAEIVQTVTALLSAPDEEIDFARAKLTIDALVDPGIDVDARLAQIDEMVRRIQAMIPPNATGVQKLEAVRAFIYDSGTWNGHRPFQYDMDDPLGTKLPNKLLANYLESRRGNCVTMPFLFIILADRLGLNVSASTAPLHVFVKYHDEATGTTFNLETTSGALPARDAHYRKNLPMTDKAVANGVYMQALTRKEAVAVMATLLMEHAIEQGRFETAIAVGDVVLEHYPRYVYAMLKKGSAFFKIMKRDFFGRYPSVDEIPAEKRPTFEHLSRNNRLAFSQAEALGWRDLVK